MPTAAPSPATAREGPQTEMQFFAAAGQFALLIYSAGSAGVSTCRIKGALQKSYARRACPSPPGLSAVRTSKADTGVTPASSAGVDASQEHASYFSGPNPASPWGD